MLQIEKKRLKLLFESDISIFRIPLTRILSEKTHQAQSYMMIYAPMFATSIQKWTGVTDLRKGIEKIQKKRIPAWRLTSFERIFKDSCDRPYGKRIVLSLQ